MSNNPKLMSQRVRKLAVRGGSVLLALGCIGGGVALGLAWRQVRADPLAAQRKNVAELTPDAKEELRQKAERFAKLPANEQERLRSLQSQVAGDEKSPELRDAMQRYYHWLSELNQTQREELRALKGDTTARVAKVLDIQRDRDRRAPLSPEDHRVVAQWHLQNLEARVPEERRQELEEFKANRPRELHFRIWGLLPEFSPMSREFFDKYWSQVTEQEIQRLHEALSTDAKAKLAREVALADKRQLAEKWVQMVFYSRRWSPRGHIKPEELARFFQNDLPKDERDRLLKLNDEERGRRLRFLYLQKNQPANNRPGAGGERPEWERPGGDRPNNERPDGERRNGAHPGRGCGEGPRT